MKKKATKEIQDLSVAGSPQQKVLSNAPSSGLTAGNTVLAEEEVSPFAREIAATIDKQLSVLPSEGDVAISSVIDSILGYVENNEGEKGEMKQFLETLVDTDPVLKAELLEILKR
jgi:hypothetical protein